MFVQIGQEKSFCPAPCCPSFSIPRSPYLVLHTSPTRADKSKKPGLESAEEWSEKTLIARSAVPVLLFLLIQFFLQILMFQVCFLRSCMILTRFMQSIMLHQYQQHHLVNILPRSMLLSWQSQLSHDKLITPEYLMSYI